MYSVDVETLLDSNRLSFLNVDFACDLCKFIVFEDVPAVSERFVAMQGLFFFIFFP